MGEVVVSECVQRPGRGIHAGLTPECNNVNGVRRPCTVLGALENARGRTGLAATIPHHPPRALRILQLPGLLLLGGIPAEGRARETMGARLGRQMGLRPPPTCISRR